MDRADAMGVMWEHFKCDLPNLCLRVHMSVTGSSDPMDPAELRLATLVLHRRRKHWVPSTSAFDASVLAMLTATIAEAEQYIARNPMSPEVQL